MDKSTLLEIEEIEQHIRQYNRQTAKAQREKNRQKNKGRDPYHDKSAKPCTKCKRILRRENFHRNATTKDGLAFHCKMCVSRASRNNKKRKAIYFNGDLPALAERLVELTGKRWYYEGMESEIEY